MKARGVPCPACDGNGSRDVTVYRAPWADHSVTCEFCDGLGQIVVPRRLTRAQWQRRCELAYLAEQDAQFAPSDDTRAEAARMRAEASVPADPREAERNARWFHLQAALIAARLPCALLRGARQLARAA